MTEFISIYEREQAQLQQIRDLVATDLEAFRREATRVYGIYNRQERAFLAKFVTQATTGYDVLSLWESTLLPVLHTLRTKRSETAFRTAMVKHLLLDADETQSTIHSVVSLRESEVIQKFIATLYGPRQKKDAYRKQRKQVMDLLLLFPQEIIDLKKHHIDYMLYKYVAAENKITVVDPHASAWTRFKSSRRVRSERKKIARFEKERLAFIATRMHELRQVNDGIVAEILDKDIDLVVVLGLRNQYEKRIAKLSGSDAQSVAKRLAIFDSETQAFRDTYTDKLSGSTADTSLELARTITKSIDGLLLHIFDLSVTGKNQLLLYTKEYRELAREKATILHTQKQRKLTT